jgi:hypothetical protein
MAIQASLLRSKSLTPHDFAKLSLEKPPARGAAAADRSSVRQRSRSASEDAFKDFALKDYIHAEHLTVFVAGEFFGFSAFFLALSSSAYKFVGKVTKIHAEDTEFTQIIKTAFSQSFVQPFMSCHAQQLDQTGRYRILVENFAPLMRYFYDHGLRSDRLTQKTLEEAKKPNKLPFAFQTPEEMPAETSQKMRESFFNYRDACINLRSSESASNYPRCIEYFENFLMRMDHTFQSIQEELKVVFFKNHQGDEELDLFLTDAYFEQLLGRQLGLDKLSRYLMFIRDRSWNVLEDHYFFPSLEIEAKTLDKQVKYRLRSVTYVMKPFLMTYATFLMQPSGKSYKWTHEDKTPFWLGDMRRSFKFIEDKILKKELEEDHIIDHRLDSGMLRNTDCCIYELVGDV